MYVLLVRTEQISYDRYQPCLYTVRVSEVFKGSYSVSYYCYIQCTVTHRIS